MVNKNIKSSFEAQRAIRIIPNSLKAAYRYITGKYNHHPRSIELLKWIKYCKDQNPKHPKGVHAHLHFNLRSEYRGGNLG